MPVTASDIVVYGSASMPDDDTATDTGGAIDLTTRIVFTDLSSNSALEVVSDNAADTGMTITVTGRNAAGEILVAGPTSVNGTTVVALTGTFERVLKASLSGVAAGTVTLRVTAAGGDLMVFEPSLTDIRRPFYAAESDVAGGSTKTYYEKVFFKNTHATLSLTSAVISEQADPNSVVAFGLEPGAGALDGVDTNGGGNNRQVAPAAYTFNSSAKNVVNSQNHTAGAAQGVWLQLTLTAGLAAANTSFTLREAGTST